MRNGAKTLGIVTGTALALLLLGHLLLSGASLQAQPPSSPTFVDRGFLTVRVSGEGGTVQAEEAYAVLRTAEEWEFSLNARLVAKEKGFEARTQSVLTLSPELQPVRYRASRVAQALAEGDREVWEINLLWGEVVAGEFRLGEEDLALVEPNAPAKTFSGGDSIPVPVQAPWIVIEMDTFSPFALVPLLFLEARDAEEQQVLTVMPLPRRSFERTIQRADPVRIVDNATGAAQQAERLLWIRGPETPPLEVLFQTQGAGEGYTFLGIRVAEEAPAFVYRRDLFPQGFRVERD